MDDELNPLDPNNNNQTNEFEVFQGLGDLNVSLDLLQDPNQPPTNLAPDLVLGQPQNQVLNSEQEQPAYLVPNPVQAQPEYQGLNQEHGQPEYLIPNPVQEQQGYLAPNLVQEQPEYLVVPAAQEQLEQAPAVGSGAIAPAPQDPNAELIAAIANLNRSYQRLLASNPGQQQSAHPLFDAITNLNQQSARYLDNNPLQPQVPLDDVLDPYTNAVLPVDTEAAPADAFGESFPNLFEEYQPEAQEITQIEQAQNDLFGNSAPPEDAGAVAGSSRNPCPRRRRKTAHEKELDLLRVITKQRTPLTVVTWSDQEVELLSRYKGFSFNVVKQELMAQMRNIGSDKSVKLVKEKLESLQPARRCRLMNQWTEEEEAVLSKYYGKEFDDVHEQVMAELRQIRSSRSRDKVERRIKRAALRQQGMLMYTFPEKVRAVIEDYVNSGASRADVEKAENLQVLVRRLLQIDPNFPSTTSWKMRRIVARRWAKQGQEWERMSREEDNDMQELLLLYDFDIKTVFNILAKSQLLYDSQHKFYRVLRRQRDRVRAHGLTSPWTDEEVGKLVAEVTRQESLDAPVDWKMVKDPMLGRSIACCQRKIESLCRDSWTRENTHKLLRHVDGVLRELGLIKGRDLEQAVYDQDFTMIPWNQVKDLFTGVSALMCELRYRAIRDRNMAAKTEEEDDYMTELESLQLRLQDAGGNDADNEANMDLLIQEAQL